MNKKLFRICFCLLSIVFLTSASPVHAVTTKLKVALNCNMPPYQFVDKDGHCAGMHIDILDAIAEDKGLVIEYIPMEKTSNCTAALDKGEVDLVLGIVIDPNSKYTGQFTQEISSSTLCMIAPNSFIEKNDIQRNLKNGIAVFEYGTASYSLISKLGASMCLAVGNQKEVFDTHTLKKADVMVGVKSSMLYQLYQRGMEDDYSIIHNYMATVRYAMVVQNGDDELMRYLNSGISTLRANSGYGNIYSRWTIDEGSNNMKALIVKIAYISATIGAAAAAYIIFSIRIRSILKKRVVEQTQEIQSANAELERRIVQIQDESALRNSIIEYSPNGMVLFDRNYNIKLMNNSACNLAGISRMPIGESVLSLGFFKDILKSRMEELFVERQDLNNQIVTLPSAQGETRTYRCNIHQTMEYGESSGALLTVMDVTKEEKEKQESFEKEKSKALNRMIAGIAHEIKNPLMSIRTFATLMKTKRDDRQFQELFEEFVPKEVDRMNKLIESLINYAKPMKGTVERIDVKAAIGDCMYLTRTVVKQGRIRVEVSAEDGLMIEADKNQIKQVLINIIINGIESMEKKLKELDPEKGPPLILNVWARAEDENIIITIRDEGNGMSEKELRRCADPFFTTKATGTGLGLALSKHFIQENNGDLLIESVEREYTSITIVFRRCN
ncbi:transporter substrate-binding domain-containing protein [Oscillospiraceae bacterium PP1C4]